MDNIKHECKSEINDNISKHMASVNEDINVKPDSNVILKFKCSVCELHENYDYFGMNPPYMRNYILLEDSYIIEDPFLPPKQGELIILAANCIKCKKSVCKDQECSIYFDGTICLNCAKNSLSSFPTALQEKLNKLINR